MVPPYTNTAGMFMRAMAMSARGRFGAQREIVELRVARSDRAVGVGDPDDRLREVLVGEPHGAEHGAVRRPLHPGGDRPAPERAHAFITLSTSSRRASISIGRLARAGGGSRSRW